MRISLKNIRKIPLVVKIFIGLIFGIILGLLIPNIDFIGIFGKLFISALKAIAPVLVFALITSSLCDAGKGISSRFRTVILLYLISTLLAAFISVCGSFLFPITVPLDILAEEGLDIFKYPRLFARDSKVSSFQPNYNIIDYYGGFEYFLRNIQCEIHFYTLAKTSFMSIPVTPCIYADHTAFVRVKENQVIKLNKPAL